MKNNNQKKSLRERIEEHIEIKYLSFLILLAGGSIVILVFFLFFFPRINSGGGSLSDASRNSGCGENIQEALRMFSRNMNLPYNTGPDDYKTVFNEGCIQKEYDRDGIHYTVYFQIHKTGEGCFLKFYKRGRSQPGKHETTLGDYGSLVLKRCECK